jgi:deazaflavin-dependent oxidoreductase (nitroreductase family)
VHRLLYQVSGGRIGDRFEVMKFLLLTTTGRRTGQPRVTPLMTFPDGDRYVVVASNGGRDQFPCWYLNLAADPDVVVQVGRRRFAARASVLEGEARDELWPRLTAYYGGWAYSGTLTARPIPVVALTPTP